jgi:hypothetical protein
MNKPENWSTCALCNVQMCDFADHEHDWVFVEPSEKWLCKTCNDSLDTVVDDGDDDKGVVCYEFENDGWLSAEWCEMNLKYALAVEQYSKFKGW